MDSKCLEPVVVRCQITPKMVKDMAAQLGIRANPDLYWYSLQGDLESSVAIQTADSRSPITASSQITASQSCSLDARSHVHSYFG